MKEHCIVRVCQCVRIRGPLWTFQRTSHVNYPEERPTSLLSRREATSLNQNGKSTVAIYIYTHTHIYIYIYIYIIYRQNNKWWHWNQPKPLSMVIQFFFSKPGTFSLSIYSEFDVFSGCCHQHERQKEFSQSMTCFIQWIAKIAAPPFYCLTWYDIFEKYEANAITIRH